MTGRLFWQNLATSCALYSLGISTQNFAALYAAVSYWALSSFAMVAAQESPEATPVVGSPPAFQVDFLVDSISMSELLPPDARSVARRVSHLQYSPDGKTLAIRNGDNQVMLLELRTKQARVAEGIRRHHNRIEDLAFNPQGDTLYAVTAAGTPGLIAWRVSDLEIVLNRPQLFGQRLSVGSDGKIYVHGAELICFDPQQADASVRRWKADAFAVLDPLPMLVKVVSGDRQSLRWMELLWMPLAPSQEALSYPIPILPLQWKTTLEQNLIGKSVTRRLGLQVSPDANRLVLIDDRAIALWEVAVAPQWSFLEEIGIPGRDVRFMKLNGRIFTFAFSPDSQFLVLGTVGNSETPGQAIVIDAVAGQVVGTIANSPRSITALGFSPDGLRLAVGSSSLQDDRIQIIDFETWLFSQSDAVIENPVSTLADSDPRVAAKSVGLARTLPLTAIDALFAPLDSDFEVAANTVQICLQGMTADRHQQRQEAESALTILLMNNRSLIQSIDQEQLSAEVRFRVRRTIASLQAGYRLPLAQWLACCRGLRVLQSSADPQAATRLQTLAQHPLLPLARQANNSLQIWQKRFATEIDP